MTPYQRDGNKYHLVSLVRDSETQGGMKGSYAHYVIGTILELLPCLMMASSRVSPPPPPRTEATPFTR